MYYLNPKRKFTAENDTIAKMKHHGETIRSVEQPCEDRPTRKHLFLPSTTETPDDNDTDEETDIDSDERPNYRQEMREELGVDEADLGGEISPVARLLSDLRGEDEEPETTTSDGDSSGFVVF